MGKVQAYPVGDRLAKEELRHGLDVKRPIAIPRQIAEHSAIVVRTKTGEQPPLEVLATYPQALRVHPVDSCSGRPIDGDPYVVESGKHGVVVCAENSDFRGQKVRIVQLGPRWREQAGAARMVLFSLSSADAEPIAIRIDAIRHEVLAGQSSLTPAQKGKVAAIVANIRSREN